MFIGFRKFSIEVWKYNHKVFYERINYFICCTGSVYLYELWVNWNLCVNNLKGLQSEPCDSPIGLTSNLPMPSTRQKRPFDTQCTVIPYSTNQSISFSSHLYQYLGFSLYLYLSIYMPLSISLYLYLSIYISLSFFLSISRSIYVF